MRHAIVVGGDIDTGRQSSIIKMLAEYLGDYIECSDVYNGVLPPHEKIRKADVVVWAPNIPNEVAKDYPRKGVGAVLICTKVIHGDRTEADAVTRIFAMHGNAVIAIHKDDPKNIRFKLIDALGNTWADTTDLRALAGFIDEFVEWTNGQERKSYQRSVCVTMEKLTLPEELIRLNTIVADKAENKMGARYFGNFSTRCMRMFPSFRNSPGSYMFSPRNTDKSRLTPNDFVLVEPPYYYGERKYSVDTPCQVAIYEAFPEINFMIHGHAYIEGAPTTEHYFPCGDLREVPGIIDLMNNGHCAFNLKNHGFLLVSEDLDHMSLMVEVLTFVQKDILR